MRPSLQKKGAIEFDKLVVIVIALAVLLIVIIFFKTGFGNLGANVGTVGKNATGQTPTVTRTITGTISNVTGQWA